MASQLFTKLNELLSSIKPAEVTVMVWDDLGLPDKFAAMLEDMYNPDEITDKINRQAYFAEFKAGEWDEEIKSCLDSISVYVEEIHQRDRSRQDEKEKEQEKSNNWQGYEKKLGYKREADIDDVLGAYAFPFARSGTLPKEPDTSTEFELLRSLSHHLDMSGEIPRHLSDIIVEILKSGKYSKVFKRCVPGTEIYRGMSVKKNWIESAVGENFDPAYKNGQYNGHLTFTPRSGKYSTSWSLNDRIAANFRPGQYEPGTYSIMMTCQVSDDMYALDCSRLYYELPQFDMLAGEQEVICFGPVKCKSVIWIRTGYDAMRL